MKKVLIPVMALLVLFVVAPVMAAPATKIPFISEASFGFGNVSPGEEWITADGVYHLKGAVSEGTTDMHSAYGDISGALMIRHDLALDTKYVYEAL